MHGSFEGCYARDDRHASANSFKGTRPEYSVYLSLAAGICIFSYMTGKLSYLFSSVLKIQEYLPVDAQYLETLLKMIGITYVSEFAAGICKDAGYG